MIDKINNVVYDANYQEFIKFGGFLNFDKNLLTATTVTTTTTAAPNTTPNAIPKKGLVDKILDMIFGPVTPKKLISSTSVAKVEEVSPLAKKSLDEQIRHIVNLPMEEYSDKLLTEQLRKHIVESEKQYIASLADYKSHISPSFWEVKGGFFNVSGVIGKTYFATNYPSYIDFLRTRDVLGFYCKWDISWFLYPTDDRAIQSVMKRRSTQLRAELSEAASKGITVDTELEIEYQDIENIRQKLATREERYFETSFYCTIYHDEPEKLKEECRKFEQKMGGFGIKIKPAIQRMDEGLNSTLPLAIDDLGIYRSMVTTSLAGSFPFISNDLIENGGILYGINLHTGSLVIFDRFSSKVPNFNSIILATSGAGKSFAIKLEVLRYLLIGIDVIVIDPENEYKSLVDKVGGSYVNIAVNSRQCINPFDMPPKIEDVDYGKGDLLRSQIMSLIGLISVLVGGITAKEESLLDKALQATYNLKEITFDTENFTGKEPPLMQDLYNILEGMDGGEELSIKLSKFVTGTFAKLFNNFTNIDLDSGLTVFNIRDLEDVLKTSAMYNILGFIWTKVRAKKKKRLLICDEAWIMLSHETSANFLFGLIKRARKYGLGITTITQDVEDFMKSKYGKPIVSNSSIQLLLKQSIASIKSLEQVFGLSEAEKQKLISSNVGEGLFFVGPQHVALKILASPYEKDFITTDVKK